MPAASNHDPPATLAALVLMVPDKDDAERDAVQEAWRAGGGSVVRIARFWDPPALDRSRARVYGNDTFCLVIAQKFGLLLVSPDEEVMARAPREILHRSVQITSLANLSSRTFPVFAKPVLPKQFRAAIYPSVETLMNETCGLTPDCRIIVSDIVRFQSEARAFLLDGVVQACSVYEGHASRDDAARFAQHAAGAIDLPRTCVLDVGLLQNGTWALVECNATWGAGLNGCEASNVLHCIAAATELA